MVDLLHVWNQERSTKQSLRSLWAGEPMKTEPKRIHNHGYVMLVDTMPAQSGEGDHAVVDAARVSYAAGCKRKRSDEGLIDYLMRNRHCYAPWMEVLTAAGWKRWDECEWTETFMVPDPVTRTLLPEQLNLEMFDCDEELVTFDSNRMSFAVTPDHRMWFKGKYQSEFSIVRVGEMKRWGHFDPLSGYKLQALKDCSHTRDTYAFLGFILGDGCYENQSAVSFHLKKSRKIEYLVGLLQRLGVEYTQTDKETCKIYVPVPDLIRELYSTHTTWGARSRDKDLFGLDRLEFDELEGLREGLSNSDGSEKVDRPQVEFSSVSLSLVKGWEVVNALLGTDAHRVSGSGINSTAFHGDRITLEARKQYFGAKYHRGQVFCATTSTGLLMVRGGPDKFAFVCGNTSPFEMVELKFEVRAPIMVFRQWHRHRTASINEESGRYSVLKDEFYLPHYCRIRGQDAKNRQGSNDAVLADANLIRWCMENSQKAARTEYEYYLQQGVAREIARVNLPVSCYSSMVWKTNLHNFFHFSSLRRDGHAQEEIRDYANAMFEMVRPLAPVSCRAWEEHVFYAKRLSRTEWVEVQKRLKRLAELDSKFVEEICG